MGSYIRFPSQIKAIKMQHCSLLFLRSLPPPCQHRAQVYRHLRIGFVGEKVTVAHNVTAPCLCYIKGKRTGLLQNSTCFCVVSSLVVCVCASHCNLCTCECACASIVPVHARCCSGAGNHNVSMLLQQKQLVRSPVAFTVVNVMLHNMVISVISIILYTLTTILPHLSLLYPKNSSLPGEDSPRNRTIVILLHYVSTLPPSLSSSLCPLPATHLKKPTQTPMDLSLS